MSKVGSEAKGFDSALRVKEEAKDIHVEIMIEELVGCGFEVK
jgi:hypothetical protein